MKMTKEQLRLFEAMTDIAVRARNEGFTDSAEDEDIEKACAELKKLGIE